MAASSRIEAAPAAARRSVNERMVLTLLRRRELPKAELARLTGLSATAIGGIIRQLEADGLVTPGAPQKGRVGQPSVPYSLSPGGACALGLKIGRRSAELALLDARLDTLALAETVYAWPEPEAVLDFAAREGARMLRKPERRRRLAGVGVAMPSEIWCWSAEMGAPAGALEAWRELDLAAAVGARLSAPVFVSNDASAACAAQLALAPVCEEGAGGQPLDFVYFFVGWFIGGGVVLGGRVLEGRRGNAGALGSTPICAEGGAPEQLIRRASLYFLEHEVRSLGVSSEMFWARDPDWSGFGAALDAWIERAAAGVAQAAAAAASVIDFDAAVIDGSFPPEVRARFAARVAEAYRRLDRQGLSPLRILEGGVGRNARAVGAACLPLLDRFGLDAATAPAVAELRLDEA